MRAQEIIARRFEIERQIGAGGMGTVFRARDLDSGRPVAVKQLDIRNKNDAERFEREAQVLAELRHPGIVRYIAHGKTEKGEHYIAMEWLEGETLQDRLTRGRLSILEVVQLGVRVAEALAAAHKRGVIHRDVKPPNLFLLEGQIDRTKLLDFGVARVTGGAGALTMTRTGALIGTPGYMAPEQARGEKELDFRADVFALGSVLFECLTGRPAFSGQNVMAVLAKILLAEAPRVHELRSDVPPALDELVAAMLAKEPLERPPDAQAVGEALTRLTLGDITQASPGLATLRDEEPVTKPPSLTTIEQRLLCVVLAGQMEGTARTWSPDETAANNVQIYRVVEEHGGQLDELVDGSLLVSLRGEGAATDLAARAARCALALRTLLPDVPIVLASGRGVVSGRVPVGEVIDRAALALASVKAAGVRLDAVSAGLLESLGYELEQDEFGHALVRGSEGSGGRRHLLGKSTSCVGRDRELATLEATFSECAGEPVARAVLVVGPAGIGKSRLAQEFLRRQNAKGDELLVLSARGDVLKAGAPFALARELLGRTAGLSDGEPLKVRQQKLETRVARHLPRERVERLLPFLGELASVQFPAEGNDLLARARGDAMLMGDSIRAAWEEWLMAEAEHAPVLLLLEDLQWGDLPSAKLVDAALRHLADRPLLVLALARPELNELFPGLWAERGVQELRLSGLTKKAAEKLVSAVLGPDLPASDLRFAVDRADGNPFYLEELIRALHAGKGSELPETILGMIQARLDALGPEAKRVLRAASVFGHSFWRGSVISLLGGGESTSRVSEWLDDLVDREVVSRQPQSRFPGETEYSFRQALVRDAAYAMLTEEDRRLGHSLAGEWLEAAGEKNAGVLAEHFQRGRDPKRAVGFFRRAAEQALEGNDFKRALDIAGAGIDAGAEGEVLGALHQIAAEAYAWLGRPADAEQALSSAIPLLRQGSAPWYRAVAEMVAALCRQARLDFVEAWAEQAATAARVPGAAAAQVSCLARTAENLLVVGRYKLAEQVLEALERGMVGDETLDPLATARVHRCRARRGLHRGDPAAYARGLMEAARAFEQAGDLRNATNERMNLGFAYAELGQYVEAERALSAALAAAQRMGLSHVVAWAENNLGNVLGRLGRGALAEEVEGRAVQAGERQHDPRLLGNSRLYLAHIALLGGDAARAEKEAGLAEEALVQVPALRAVAMALVAQARLRGERPAEALEPATRAMAILDELGAIEEGESLVRLAEAEALAAAGQLERARRALARARDRLLIRAARISEPVWRESFLDLVEENRRTLALALEWKLDEAETLRDL